MLLLSGTLFRHDEGTIPFVTYDKSGTLAPDFEYSYTSGLKDRIVGPIYFPTFRGKAEWQFGEQKDAIAFGEAASDRRLARQLNTAIVSETWLSTVIRAADTHLDKIRKQDATAGGLIVAKSQAHARAVAPIVEQVSGLCPEIALSDIAKSNKVISDFACGQQKWIVAVKMISEGVDIPRLRVGVYASNILTELFFRQVVGRLVRTYRPFTSQDAYLYIPQHPVLLAYAESIAEERYHTLTEAMDISTVGGVKEVFGALEPGHATAEQGETLNPLQIEPETNLLALLQAGFAALDVAQNSLQQARTCFEQVAASLSMEEYRQVESLPTVQATDSSLTESETKLLTIFAKHRRAAISQSQLEALFGHDKMHFYDCLASVAMTGYLIVDSPEQVSITEKGVAVLGNDLPRALISGTDIIRLWSEVLTTRESELLQGLLHGYPDWLERKPLIALTKYKESIARNIGPDLNRLVAVKMAQTNHSNSYRLNPRMLEIPFTGY